MKKILGLVIALMLCEASMFAQTAGQPLYHQREVSVSYGQITVPQVVYSAASIIGTAFSFGLWKMDEMHLSGAISAEYNYWINDKFSVGGAMVYDEIHGYTVKKDDTKESFNIDFGSLMVLGKYSWFNREHVGMYSKLGLGASIMKNDNESSVLAAFQLTPVACEFGSPALRGYVELGAGYQGFILAGIRYRF